MHYALKGCAHKKLWPRFIKVLALESRLHGIILDQLDQLINWPFKVIKMLAKEHPYIQYMPYSIKLPSPISNMSCPKCKLILMCNPFQNIILQKTWQLFTTPLLAMKLLMLLLLVMMKTLTRPNSIHPIVIETEVNKFYLTKGIVKHVQNQI